MGDVPCAVLSCLNTEASSIAPMLPVSSDLTRYGIPSRQHLEVRDWALPQAHFLWFVSLYCS